MIIYIGRHNVKVVQFKVHLHIPIIDLSAGHIQADRYVETSLSDDLEVEVECQHLIACVILGTQRC